MQSFLIKDTTKEEREQIAQMRNFCCSMFQRLCDSMGIRYPKWMEKCVKLR